MNTLSPEEQSADPTITPNATETVTAETPVVTASKEAVPAQPTSVDQAAISSIRKSLETIPASSAATESTNSEIKHQISPVLPVAEAPTIEQPAAKKGIFAKVLGLFNRSKRSPENRPSLPENVISFEEKRAQLQKNPQINNSSETPSGPATITNMQDYLAEKDVKNSLANAEKGGEWVPAEQKPA